MSKFRIVWNPEELKVTAVTEAQEGTITNYPDGNEHAVVGNIETIKQILLSQGYDVLKIQEYQDMEAEDDGV